MHRPSDDPPAGTRPVPSTDAATVPWGAIAVPAEHGGWGLLGEPVVLGLALAPSVSGACLALAAVLAFLARHPLRLVLMDRRRGARYPRSALAARFFLAFAGAAALALALAFATAQRPFVAALAVAAPFALVTLGYDALGRGREALPEAAGAVALSAAAAAIALAGGQPAAVAFAAAGLLALRALTSVLYVRARIRLDRGLPAGPGRVLALHAVALLAAALLAGAGAAPWLGAAAFAVLLVRAAFGLRAGRAPIRPQLLGLQELAHGLLTLALLVVGYRAAV